MKRFATAVAATLIFVLGACSGQNVAGPPVDPIERPEGQSVFDTPGGDSYSRGLEGDGQAGAAGGTPAPSNEATANAPAPSPERLIEEADLFKLVGNTLYVLNEYRGLYALDISNLDGPKVTGRAPIFGYPKEMYVRGNRAYVIVSDYYSFWRDEAALVDGPVHAFYGSQLRILDIADPASPHVIGGINLEGDLVDSRIVGDVMYLVANRYSWYYRYSSSDSVDKTTILSVTIADPSNVHVVDKVDFPRNGWEHHIMVNAKAIYLASSGYENNNWQAGYVTRIRYIDIEDPAGQIKLRGEARVPGRVQDRWSMNEHEGALRVASGQSWGNGDVFLNTFDVANPDAITRLGGYTLYVNENLTAARFDGKRGYLVSYRNIDPLFTFDLTNPALPVLLGELEMSGWLDFIVPLGDRLVALGHEDKVNPETGRREISLAVSLIDVSTQDRPKLLGRVRVGDGWGWVPGDRDDFEKVFKVLPDLGLILFPFQAWDQRTYQHIGGVQLLDFTRDTLTKRGLIGDAGWVQRGIPFDEKTVFTLGNEYFQIMDITNRDNPRLRGRLELARNVSDFHPLDDQYAVQLSGDWYTGDTKISVTSLADPDSPTPLAQIRVPAPYGRMFINGRMAYVASVQNVYDASDVMTGRRTKVQVIDLTNPLDPKLRGSVWLPEEVWVGYRYWYWGSGDEVVQVKGSTLAFHRYRYPYYDCFDCGVSGGIRPAAAQTTPVHKVYLLDMANADQPRLASTVEIQDANWMWGMKAAGSTIYMSEYRSYQRDERWYQRYYLRRIDVADPANPRVLQGVNVPGMFIDAASEGPYIYTLEAYWDYEAQIQRTLFHALALLGDRAYLRSSVELKGWVNNVQVVGTAAFTTTQRYEETLSSGGAVSPGGSTWRNISTLVAVDLSNPRALRVADEAEVPYDYAYLQKVEGGRAFIGSGAGIFSYLVTNPAELTFEKFFRTQGWSQDISVRGSKAFVASGYYGVQVLDLGSGPHL